MVTPRDRGPRWYDIDGQPITIEEAERLLGDIEARRIAVTDLGDGRELSTVHLVLDHNYFGDGPPMIFETMLFPECDPCIRTPTKHAALAAHDQVLAELREETPG